MIARAATRSRTGPKSNVQVDADGLTSGDLIGMHGWCRGGGPAYVPVLAPMT